jgi:hypothetical protein
MSPAAFVTLKSGLTLPIAAVRVALDLELRGLVLRIDGGQILIDGPIERVTDEDLALIRRWQAPLLAMVEYVEREAGQ